MAKSEYNIELAKVQSRFFIDRVGFSQTMSHFKKAFGDNYRLYYELDPFIDRIAIHYYFVTDRKHLDKTIECLKEILGYSCEYSINFVNL